MQSANAYKLKIGEKRFSAVFYRSPSIIPARGRDQDAYPWQQGQTRLINKLMKTLAITP